VTKDRSGCNSYTGMKMILIVQPRNAVLCGQINTATSELIIFTTVLSKVDVQCCNCYICWINGQIFLDYGGQIDAVYTDFEKAFDIVPHKRLLSKLHSY